MGCGASKTSAQVAPTIEFRPASSSPTKTEQQKAATESTKPATVNHSPPRASVEKHGASDAETKVTVTTESLKDGKRDAGGKGREDGAREEEKKVHAPLSRPVMPSIPSSDGQELKKDRSGSLTKLKLKPVAFEIPLDDDLIARPVSRAGPVGARDLNAGSAGSSSSQLSEGNGALRATPSAKKLPKLGLTEQDLQAKLANTEARWKDLDQRRSSGRLRGTKPKLPTESTTTPSTVPPDPSDLKQRLLTKETLATQRRARELEKLQAKLAKQEAHARKVQERKRMLGKGSNEDLRLSWGGEKEFPVMGGGGSESDEGGMTRPTTRGRIFDEDEPVVGATRPATAVDLEGEGVGFGFGAKGEGYKPFDADSGKGSSRGGSGRSVLGGFGEGGEVRVVNVAVEGR
ncbi:hypothetical protein HDV00_006201 [Rhizophlyctis rosea]|nr:hypothetical protein HDV00_006201 [Rhizophlyctis rosea]